MAAPTFEPAQHAEASPQPATHAPLAAAPEPRPSAPSPAEPAAPEPAASFRPPETETADLTRREDQTHFRLVLRDDRLGRVSLNLTERAGLIDLMVRADKGTTVRALQSSLPALVDSLAQRGLATEKTADSAAYAPDSAMADARDAQHDRGRRERRPHDAKPRIRARRIVSFSPASAE